MNTQQFLDSVKSTIGKALVGNKYWSHQGLAVVNRGGQTHRASQTKPTSKQYLPKPDKFMEMSMHHKTLSIGRAFSWFSGHDNVTIFKHLASARQCAKGLPRTSIQSSPCWALAVTSKARKFGELTAAAAKRRLKSCKTPSLPRSAFAPNR